MSHAGNNSSRRLQNLPPHVRPIKEGEQMYIPSVFRYKCIGYLQLNSDQKGSPGVCRGLQSRIERVANMVPDTREAAIKKFLEAASDLGTYVDSDETADQKTKQIYTSRTMIYKDDDDDVNEAEEELVADRNQRASISKAPKSSPFPEEDLIDKTEWSCYGSTQVHYLVLDPVQTVRKVRKVQTSNTRLHTRGGQNNNNSPALPPEVSDMEKKTQEMVDGLMKRLGNFDNPFTTGVEKSVDKDDSGKEDSHNNHNANDENKKDDTPPNKDGVVSTRTVVTTVTSSSRRGGKISAITPENIGLSVRKIDSEVGHFTVADIGSVRICLETSGSLMGDEDTSNTSNNNNINNTQQQQQQRQELSKTTTNTGMKPEAMTSDKHNTNTKDQENKEEKKRTVDLKKFYEFTQKTAAKMVHNVHEVKDAVSEDFPGRSYRFGTKVVNRMEHTTEQTFTYMGKIFDSWWRSM